MCWLWLLFFYLPFGNINEAFCQTNSAIWRWSNPQPHGGNIVDMTAKLGVKIQVAEHGQLYTSEDFLLWLPKTTGVTNSLRSATFLGERLIVTAEAGLILYADSLEEFVPVSLSTTNWLESVAASDITAVAVGDNGSVYTSSDGAAWTQKNLPANNKTWLRSVAYGGNGFVTVGENGYIATGNNAAQSWTARSSGVSTHLNRVAYITDKFWAVGDSGQILKSTDGSSWTKVTTASVTNHLYAIAGTNSSILVAGEQIALLSEDGGTTWKKQTAATDVAQPAPTWTYYSALYTDGIFLLGGRSGMTVEGFKTNTTAQVWVERNDSYRQWLWAVHRLADFYVAVGDHATIMTSSRGVNWELELPPNEATNNIFLGVGGTTNGTVIVGNQGTILFSPPTPVTVLSTNTDSTITTNLLTTLGTLWQAVTPKLVSVDLQGVAMMNNLYLVCGGTGTILTSTNGTNWAPQISGSLAFLSSLATNSSLAVAVGNLGTILTSPNGTNWTPRISGTTRWLFKVKQFDGSFVAVGEQGTILTSPDGITWTSRTSGVTNWLNDVERVNGEFYVAGNQGTMLRSTNLINWSSSVMPTQKSLFGLASNGGQLVTVGVEGAILRSSITADLTPVKFIDYGVAAGQSLYLLSGLTDQKFATETSTNLVDWVEGVTFEIVDRSGTLLIKQINDTTATNQQFLRARMVP
jgi:photosystem II stability/assembly factor-like uncharacterized protein